MKRVIFKLISVVVLLLMVVSCEKNPIEQANEEYDYSKMIPRVMAIDGPAEFIASGQQFARYTASTRGGSTFEWSVSKVSADIVVDPDDDGKTYIADIKFEQLDEDSVAIVTVVETNYFGVKSDPFTKTVSLLRFCPLEMDNFTGLYLEGDGDGQFCDVTVTRDPADDLFGLVLDGILGQNYWWGPPGGHLVIKIEGCGNTLFFDKQATGIVDPTYGMVYMELDGGVKGWIDPEDYSFGYTGKVTVAAGSFGAYPFEYTKQ